MVQETLWAYVCIVFGFVLIQIKGDSYAIWSKV